MHPTLKPRDQWSRQDVVAFHLRTLALHVDPLRGEIKALADAIEVNPITISRWATQGFVPLHQVKRLQKRYGEKLVPGDELCPAANRRS